jgi:hypothetical protein
MYPNNVGFCAALCIRKYPNNEDSNVEMIERDPRFWAGASGGPKGELRKTRSSVIGSGSEFGILDISEIDPFPEGNGYWEIWGRDRSPRALLSARERCR